MRLVWKGILVKNEKERAEIVQKMVERILEREGRIRRIMERETNGGQMISLTERQGETGRTEKRRNCCIKGMY